MNNILDMRRLAPLLPSLLGLLLFVCAFGALVVESVGGPGWDNWQIDKYTRFLSDPLYFSYLTRSLRVAAWTTAAGVLLGYGAAFAMWRSAFWRRLLLLLLVFQFFAVTVTKVYAVLLVLGDRGPFNSALLWLGFSAPLKMVGYELGVVIGLVNAALPFAVLPIYSSLATIRPSLAGAAAVHGANRFATFARIILPLSMPGISSAVVLVFLYSLGALLTPSIVGAGYVDLIASFAYEQALLLADVRFAAAGSLVTMVSAFVAVLMLAALFRRLTPKQ